MKQETSQPPERKRALKIPRNLSMVILNLKGHLFDTKCFNKCIDVCEEKNIQFRVIGWDIGNIGDESSTVTL